MDSPFISYQIEERSFVSQLKREIRTALLHHHFKETRAAEIEIIVSELTSNLIKHAGSGELLYRVWDENEKDSTFEILCMDNGPGISNPGSMMKDGISTTKTLGQGLGAVTRLSTFSQLYSLPGQGTIFYSLVSTKGSAPRKNHPYLDLQGLCVSKSGETECGDGYKIKAIGHETHLLVCDGLGHGRFAKEAVDTAEEVFMKSRERDPVQMLRTIHQEIRKTRGLVATIVVCDPERKEWKICGIGNISTRLFHGKEYRNCMSYNGTLGYNIPNTMKESVYPFERNQYLIMCSDGIKTRWDLSKYPLISKYDNIIPAACIYKDFNRRNDDASVLVARAIMS